MFIRNKALSSAILLGACVVSISGHAADEKITSSAICQAMSHAGSQHLTHLGSSLQAVGADVTVVCPIVRDNLSGKLQWVDVRYLRPNNTVGVVTGEVYSCNSTYGGCFMAAGQSSATNTFTSVFITTSGLPSGDDHYFYYRTILPQNWKIVSVHHRED